MSLTTEERAELDALKTIVKQLQTQIARLAPTPTTEPLPLPQLQRSYPPPGVNEFPLQTAPVTVNDPDALLVTPQKAPGPTGKATPEQAFKPPEGTTFDAVLPPTPLPETIARLANRS